jgi:hypothetical protein
MSREVRRDVPDVARLLRGVRWEVYQAKSYPGKPGAWHAHVSGLRYGDLDDLAMRYPSGTAEGIAYQIERKAADSTNDGLGYRQALREVLGSYATRVRVVPNGGGDWTDVGYCSTADEARERACAVIGHVLGRRLARATAGYTPVPIPVPPISEGTFS